MSNKYQTNISEETRDFFERIPDSMNTRLVLISALVFIGLITASVVIKSPDIIVAEVRISGMIPPQVLKSKGSGKLIMIIDSLPQKCVAGNYIACLQNSADAKDVFTLKEVLQSFNPLEDYTSFPNYRHLSIGELSPAYYNLERCLQAYQESESADNDYLFKINALKARIVDDSMSLKYYQKLYDNDKQLCLIKEKEYVTDSILHSRGALLEEKMNLSRIDYLKSRRELMSEIRTIETYEHNLQEYHREMQHLRYLYENARRNSQNEVLDAFNTLKSMIAQWENQYVFKADRDGTVEYANIVSENSFISVGEPVFTLAGDNNEYYGVALLPAVGAGMIANGQKVIIKIAAYPYEEYGYLQGVVTDISMNFTNEGGYYVYITLPNGLNSSTGHVFSAVKAMIGRAEIVTTDKRLFEKTFRHINRLLTEK